MEQRREAQGEKPEASTTQIASTEKDELDGLEEELEDINGFLCSVGQSLQQDSPNLCRSSADMRLPASASEHHNATHDATGLLQDTKQPPQ